MAINTRVVSHFGHLTISCGISAISAIARTAHFVRNVVRVIFSPIFDGLCLALCSRISFAVPVSPGVDAKVQVATPLERVTAQRERHKIAARRCCCLKLPREEKRLHYNHIDGKTFALRSKQSTIDIVVMVLFPSR